MCLHTPSCHDHYQHGLLARLKERDRKVRTERNDWRHTFNFHNSGQSVSQYFSFQKKKKKGHRNSEGGLEEPTCDSGFFGWSCAKALSTRPVLWGGSPHQTLLIRPSVSLPMQSSPQPPLKHCYKQSSPWCGCSRLWATAKTPSFIRDFSV